MATLLSQPYNAGQVKAASGLDVVAGLWLLLSAWIVPMSTALAWSCVIVGIAVMILAGLRAGGAYAQSWMSWINVILGLWVIVSPWALGAESQSAVWNAVATGLIIVVLAGWSAISSNAAEGDALVEPPSPGNQAPPRM